jgi:DNA-binding Xre family transcriptional regulator
MIEARSMTARFRLKELLGAHHPPMSQSELARQCGVSFVTINAISNNRTKQVQLETLDRIAEALGVAPGDLIERDDAPVKKRRK